MLNPEVAAESSSAAAEATAVYVGRLPEAAVCWAAGAAEAKAAAEVGWTWLVDDGM